MSTNTNENPLVVIESVCKDTDENDVEGASYVSDNDSFLTDDDDFESCSQVDIDNEMEIASYESYEDDDNESINATEEEKKEFKETVTDQIINAFTVKRRKAMIDQDDHE